MVHHIFINCNMSYNELQD